MMIDLEEKAKVNSAKVRKLEKTLDKIEVLEQELIQEFDENFDQILGEELVEELRRNGVKIPFNHRLLSFHKSHIEKVELRNQYEKKLKNWFSKKTRVLQEKLDHKDTAQEVNPYLPEAYALSSLAVTTFHERPNMRLYDVQKLSGIAISNGDIAELGTGEGKTLAAILPVFLHALRGKGAHVFTANSYLSKRDYDETRPIFEGLGLTTGYVPESVEDLARIEGIHLENLSFEKNHELTKKMIKIKQQAYQSQVTYGSTTAFSFDYLRDSVATSLEEKCQKMEKPGFALIDEVDAALIDDAQNPYVLGGNLPIYKKNMTIHELALALNKSERELKDKLSQKNIVIGNYQRLSYEQARNISLALYSEELMPDPSIFQKRAQDFYEEQEGNGDVYIAKDEEFTIGGRKIFISSLDLYDFLETDRYNFSIDGTEEEQRQFQEELQKIKNKKIIYYPEKKTYRISDHCYEEFLKECYFRFQSRATTLKNEQKIIRDASYVNENDYHVVEGHVILTKEGLERIIKDSNYKDFTEEYQNYTNLIHKESSELIHYLNQAIVANLMLQKKEDYIVENGMVKVVKNGRVVDGSVYNNGLHQALEWKEKIPYERHSQEGNSIASITQKDFYSRYDMFSGMTGTSSPSIFLNVFHKDTVPIPRNAFYKAYSKRLARKKKTTNILPEEIERKKPAYARNMETKIQLIVRSIEQSLSLTPKQPVLLVVSDPSEIEMLSAYLHRVGINHTVLEASIDKAKEGELIAKAGLPGSVTISTEMAGRGTDIKLGGDRNTILDIAVNNAIRRIEEKNKAPLTLTTQEREEFKKIIEAKLMAANNGKTTYLWSEKEEQEARYLLEKEGLKVISSGYFEVSRIDRQLEGRCGRNGKKGVCERYVCPKDLAYIGMEYIDPHCSLQEYFDSFPTSYDGSLLLDRKKEKKIRNAVEFLQQNKEKIIEASIMETQQLSKNATFLLEKYRSERDNLISQKEPLEEPWEEMLERTVDNLLSSYLLDSTITKEALISRFNEEEVSIDFTGLALETKEVFGITMDIASLKDQDVNLLELREALLEVVERKYEEKKASDPNYSQKLENVLLLANSEKIANLPYIFDQSTTQGRLTGLSLGMEGQEKYYANQEFYHSAKKMELESEKHAVKQLLGKPLTPEEQQTLDQRKEQLFGLTLQKEEDSYEVVSPSAKESDIEKVTTFQKLAVPIVEEAKRKWPSYEKGKEKNPNGISHFENLFVRPFQFISALSNTDSKLILVRKEPTLESKQSPKKTSLS